MIMKKMTFSMRNEVAGAEKAVLSLAAASKKHLIARIVGIAFLLTIGSLMICGWTADALVASLTDSLTGLQPPR